MSLCSLISAVQFLLCERVSNSKTPQIFLLWCFHHIFWHLLFAILIIPLAHCHIVNVAVIYRTTIDCRLINDTLIMFV